MDQRALTRSLNILAKRDDAEEALAVYGKPGPAGGPKHSSTPWSHNKFRPTPAPSWVSKNSAALHARMLLEASERLRATGLSFEK